MSDITLNASMRSNLLSLKNIATQMDKTQLILATGKKVNSAIDNASSYYQARSLTNRAADLTALLDSMGQGIQTIEAANVGIEKATSILEQMTSIANQAAMSDKVLSKEDIIKQLGNTGAVVETAQELYDAINANKETICVYGNIDLGNIDDIGKEINLAANQKLVGAGYFGDTKTESSLTATATTAKNMINITQDGCEVSDLSIDYTNEAENGSSYAIAGSDVMTKIVLGDLDIVMQSGASNNIVGAIYISNSVVELDGYINVNSSRYGLCMNNNAVCNIKAKINIQTINDSGQGLRVVDSLCVLDSAAQLNVKTLGSKGYGIFIYDGGRFDMAAKSIVNIKTSGENSFGLYVYTNSYSNIAVGSQLNIKTSGDKGYGICLETLASCDIAGNVKITTDTHCYGVLLPSTSGNKLNILSTGQIYFDTGSYSVLNNYNGGNGNNILNISAGAKLAFEKDGTAKWYQLSQNYYDENASTSANHTITADNVESTIQGIAETSAWVLPTSIEADSNDEEDTPKKNVEAYQNQFNTALKEYDKLLSDCGYQGINLLKGGNLKIVFDENREHVFNVLGQDITSKALNINEALWQTQGDIEEAINQLNTSITTLRSLAENLGNQYSIITTRINFTEALTDILETGADNLTLADMNEASAQYLSLETRQQLAINSLSLAAQSAQSILSLF